jgi:fatty acid desaturase
MSSTERVESFPLADARRLVRKLTVPDPRIYWADFSFHIVLGWGAFVIALRLPSPSIWQGLCYVVSALALYRAVIFTHELAHLKRGSFGLFRLVWNATCGAPLMVPSFIYRGVHNDHHKRALYGTKGDGEYLPFGTGRPYAIVAYLLLIFVLPLLLAGRFIVLTPLSYLHRSMRHFVWERGSSLAIDLSYRRPEPSSRDDPTWRLQELFTCLYGITAVTLVATGVMSSGVLLLWYLVTVFIFLLNSLRTLVAHRYLNPGDRAMSVSEQYLDSVNVPGNLFLTALWAPVGLRYHATHHLFPSIPYHALGEAHRRLAEELPDDSLYLRTSEGSLWEALRSLWNDARVSHLRPASVLRTD